MTFKMTLRTFLFLAAAFVSFQVSAQLVIDVQGNAGRILEINNEDQTARVRFSSGEAIRPLRELSARVSELGRYKVGETVLEQISGRKGKIESLYANGVATLEISGYPGSERSHISKLSAVSGDATEDYVDKKVMNRSGRTGSIRMVFENGFAWVQFDKHAQAEEMRNLALSAPCVGKICVGDQVIDKLTGAKGSVATVFSNGIISVFFEGNHDGKMVSVSTVRLPEATCATALR